MLSWTRRSELLDYLNKGLKEADPIDFLEKRMCKAVQLDLTRNLVYFQMRLRIQKTKSQRDKAEYLVLNTAIREIMNESSSTCAILEEKNMYAFMHSLIIDSYWGKGQDK